MKRWKIVHREADGTIMDTGLRYFFKFNADGVCRELNILDLFGAPASDIFTQVMRPYKKPYAVIRTKVSWTEFGPPSEEKPPPVTTYEAA